MATLRTPPAHARTRRVLAVRAASFLVDVLVARDAASVPAADARTEIRRLRRAVRTGSARLESAHRRVSREFDRRALAEHALATRQKEHRTLLARSRATEARLRSLSRGLLRSHEEERSRISRELHDALGQTLVGINVGLATLKGEASVRARGLSLEIARTRRLVMRSMEAVHRFARDLRPAALDHLGLIPALQTAARDFERRSGVGVTFSATNDSVLLDAECATALFRVAQEALRNVSRHARARSVRISVERQAGGIRMEIWNDGRPFDVDRMRHSRRKTRLGVLCMQERVEMVGGVFSIASGPASGTLVRADVPIAEHASA